MRLFAAIELPQQLLDDVAAWWQGACLHLPASEWRDIPKCNWHLTLAFYGDVGGQDVDDLAEELAACAAGTVPLQLRLDRFGVFPNWGRARVFWIGVTDADQGGRLKSFAHCCRRAAHATVRKPSAREEPFRGHITLARRRGFPAPLAPGVLADIPPLPRAAWTVEEVTLFQSQLCKDGARYRVVEQFDLSG